MPSPFYCPRCGKPMDEKLPVCPNCGLNLTAPHGQADEAYAMINYQEPTTEGAFRILLAKINVRLVCFCILAAAALALCFLAAHTISSAAGQIQQIRTTDGHTVSEVFDRELGQVYNGFAVFIQACGIFFTGVLIRCGLNGNK